MSSQGGALPDASGEHCLPHRRAGIQVASLANNHTLDWGRQGLRDTLGVLQGAGIQTAGGGRNRAEARQPAVVPLDTLGAGAGRVLVWAVGSVTSGLPLLAQLWPRLLTQARGESGWPGIDMPSLFVLALNMRRAVRVYFDVDGHGVAAHGAVFDVVLVRAG